MSLNKLRNMDSSKLLRAFLCCMTLMFYIGALCAPDLKEMIPGFIRIQTLPAILTKDYFFLDIGSISGCMLNYAVVGTIMCALTFLPNAKVNGTTVAAYILTVGFCSYGLNAINVLPLMFGVAVYSLIRRESFGKNINFAIFSTAIGPLISEVLYRYPNVDETHPVTIAGIGLALLLGIIMGCMMPALCAHSPNFHKGYDIYNAAPPACFICFIMYAVLYKVSGFEAPKAAAVLGEGAPVFVNVFCIVMFAIFMIAGWLINGGKTKELKEMELSDSYKKDFAALYGPGASIFNLGLYGLFVVAYYNIIGSSMTGPTMGAIFCTLSFAATATTPKNMLPIMIGYVLVSLFGAQAINSQAIIIGVCFASGLAPISGRYGFIAGAVAGAMHYCLVTSVPLIHGGFCVYNGGFTAGIVCFLLVPILEMFFKTKEERKAAK